MTTVTPEKLGQLILRKRGSMGVRAAAQEIGISPATLSRIERGHIADIQTMNKIFGWLGMDPRDYFGFKGADDKPQESTGGVQIVFKKKKTLKPQTAQALAELIMAAHKSFEKKIHAESH